MLMSELSFSRERQENFEQLGSVRKALELFQGYSES